MLQRAGNIDVISVRWPLWDNCTSTWLCDDLLASMQSPSPAALLDLDCPGGDVGGSDDIFDCLAQLQGVKPVFGIAHNRATSLAAALLALCQEPAATATAIGGSIGTILNPLYDMTEANKAAGIRVVIPHVGDFKTVGVFGAPVTPELEAMLQKYTESVNDAFLARIAPARGMSIAQLKAMQAAIYSGPQLKEVGLVDSVTPFRAYLGNLMNRFAGGRQAAPALSRSPAPAQPAEPHDAPDGDAEADQHSKGALPMSTPNNAPSTTATAGASTPATAAPAATAQTTSQTTAQTAGAAGAAPIQAAPATLAELKQIHGEDAAEVLKSLEAGHTRVQALEASNAALRIKLSQASGVSAQQAAGAAGTQQTGTQQTGAKATTVAPATVGVQGVTFRPAEVAGQQVNPFEEKVRAYMDTKQCTRVDAVRVCSQRYPELARAAYGIGAEEAAAN